MVKGQAVLDAAGPPVFSRRSRRRDGPTLNRTSATSALGQVETISLVARNVRFRHRNTEQPLFRFRANSDHAVWC
jgi:hypothetical protein